MIKHTLVAANAITSSIVDVDKNAFKNSNETSPINHPPSSTDVETSLVIYANTRDNPTFPPVSPTSDLEEYKSSNDSEFVDATQINEVNGTMEEIHKKEW